MTNMNGYKTIQIEAHAFDSNDLLRAAGVKRIHKGWYTVVYNGVGLDSSTIVGASRNAKGEINE